MLLFPFAHYEDSEALITSAHLGPWDNLFYLWSLSYLEWNKTIFLLLAVVEKRRKILVLLLQKKEGSFYGCICREYNWEFLGLVTELEHLVGSWQCTSQENWVTLGKSLCPKAEESTDKPFLSTLYSTYKICKGSPYISINLIECDYY